MRTNSIAHPTDLSLTDEEDDSLHLEAESDTEETCVLVRKRGASGHMNLFENGAIEMVDYLMRTFDLEWVDAE